MITETKTLKRVVNPADPDTIPKFVDDLPIPPVAKPKGKLKGNYYYEVTMKETKHQFHKYFPLTTVWAYDGILPGPTLSVHKNETIYVQWKNNLPHRHILPVDRTLHASEGPIDGRTVVHVHGANVDWESDGHPEAWYSRNYEVTGKTFKRKIYKYTNRQMGATLWYHDHAIGITRLNVYAGLAGFYLIRDPIEKKWRLPKGPYDIPLMVQDRSFNPDGSLFYPENTDPPAPVNPSVQPFFNGNTITVNGKVWPRLKVEPRKYRFRLLNASNTNAYTFTFDENVPMYQIATDGGFIEKPVELKSLPLFPAERSEFIIDFSKYKGKKLILRNTNDEGHLSVIMRFDVVLPLKEKDTSAIPKILIPDEKPLREKDADKVRLLSLKGTVDEFNRPLLLLDHRMWHDPVTEKPVIGTTEVWRFVNETNFPHPMHIHLIQFKVLHRRPFDLERYQKDGYIQYTGPPIPPEIHERGWKDTVRADEGMVTSVIMKFTENPGEYVWHCHILEHEDYDMMRPMTVIEKKGKKPKK